MTSVSNTNIVNLEPKDRLFKSKNPLYGDWKMSEAEQASIAIEEQLQQGKDWHMSSTMLWEIMQQDEAIGPVRIKDIPDRHCRYDLPRGEILRPVQTVSGQVVYVKKAVAQILTQQDPNK